MATVYENLRPKPPTSSRSRPSCSICFECLDRDRHLPISLYCGHTVCRTCLQSMKTNSQVVCPTCRETTNVPDDDDTKLPKNFALLDQMDEMCSNCNLPWTNRCQDCGCNVCDGCSIVHQGGHQLQQAIQNLLPSLARPRVDLSSLLESADVATDKAETDVQRLFRWYQMAADKAKDQLVEQIRQVKKDNHKVFSEWQRLETSPPDNIKVDMQTIEYDLQQLGSPQFSKEKLAHLERQFGQLSAKVLQSKIQHPTINKCHLQVDNDVTAAIGGAAVLKIAKVTEHNCSQQGQQRVERFHSATLPTRPKELKQEPTSVKPVGKKYSTIERRSMPPAATFTSREPEAAKTSAPSNVSELRRQFSSQLGENDYMNVPNTAKTGKKKHRQIWF